MERVDGTDGGSGFSPTALKTTMLDSFKVVAMGRLDMGSRGEGVICWSSWGIESLCSGAATPGS